MPGVAPEGLVVKGKKPRIILGVTGSVAAYKSIELIRFLKPFVEVKVVLTEAGSRLVSEKELKKASGSPAWTSLFKGATPIPAGTPSGTHPLAVVPHIEYAKTADLVLIAPATADILAKLALGLADDLLSTLCLYATCPLWVAPAMNVKMWNHPAVVKNQEILRGRGVRFLGPDSGHLACGEVGDGRFAEPREIALQVESYFKNSSKWRGKKVLVTAGPTQEPIDPVRVITNRSSGKMGYALAQAAVNRGAEVTLISGPVRLAPLQGVKLISVTTASEMHAQTLRAFRQTNLLIMAAAVADFRAAHSSPQKIKKKNGLVIRLKKNPDILGEVLRRKTKSQVVMGFAAETDHLEKNAMEKWRKKPCDLLVANRVGGAGTGFESDQNELLVFSRQSKKPALLKRSLKSRLAEELLDMVTLP
jgi:phosphopantothenoylcysteine decarboxylase / phosphopantothenate---cysteine ligase